MWLEGDLRRLAVALGALAFLWACGATVYLLLASSHAGIATSVTLAAGGGGTRRMLPSLATANGVWITGLLLGTALLSGIPLGVALGHPPALRATAWIVGALLLGFCLLAGFFVGLLYLPSALLLIGVGVMIRSESRGMTLAEFRA